MSTSRAGRRPSKPHQVWQRPFVAARRERIRAELTAIEADGGSASALRAAVEAAEAHRSASTLEGQLARALYALEALDRHARGGGLTSAEIDRLVRSASSTLARNGIRPGTSRVAHLYGDLHAAMARIAAAEGESWAAAWRHIVARYEGGGAAPDHHDLFRDASLALQLGLADGALTRLLEAELPSTPTVALTSLRLARARIQRLSGDLAAAEALLDELERSGAAVGADRHELAWERACIASQRTGSPEPQARLVRRERACRIPRRLLELFLWRQAARTTAQGREAPKASSLRRTASSELDPLTLRCAVTIERCYGGNGTVGARVHALGRALEHAAEIGAVDQQLLVWTAAGRWLLRVKRPDLASLPLARYRALSLGLTHGANPDVLGVASDIPLDDDVACSLEDFRFTGADAPPPSDRLRRNLAVSRMAASLARAGAGDLARRLRGRRELPEEQLLEYAEIVARYLGRLKGPIMKAGQLLSYYGFSVPPEVTAAFATLQDAAPPVDEACILGTVERELGRIDAVFASFDPRPLATGSIGQVHGAVLRSGEPVAVKVQYPGIERIIRSDLAVVALAKPVLRSLVPHWDIDGLSRELGDRVLEECDYRREGRDQRYFYELLKDEPHIQVPEPIERLTTRRVLVTERVDGLPFAAFCQDARQEERDRAGEAVMRYVIKTVSAQRAFNSDMHPGNLLFSERGVHFVDFGNVRRYAGPDALGFPRIVAAMLAGDPDALHRAFADLEFLGGETHFDARASFDLFRSRALGCLVEDRRSRFDAETIRGDIEMVLAFAATQGAVIPPKHLYFFRLYWGMFAVLAQLGAEANWRRVALDALHEVGLLQG